MNRIFKVVFNKTKGMFVVGGEHIKTQGKSKKLKLAISTVLLGTSMLAGSAVMAEDINYAGITADGNSYTATTADGTEKTLDNGNIGDGTGTVTIKNEGNDNIYRGIGAKHGSEVTINATDTEISNKDTAISAYFDSTVTINADNVTIKSLDGDVGIDTYENGQVIINSKNDVNISNTDDAISAEKGGSVAITSGGDTRINSKEGLWGIYAKDYTEEDKDFHSSVIINSQGNVTISGGQNEDSYQGDDDYAAAVWAENGASIAITSEKDTTINGTGSYGVAAQGEDTHITINSADNLDISSTESANWEKREGAAVAAYYGSDVEVTANTANITGKNNRGISVQGNEIDKDGNVIAKHSGTKATFNVANLTVKGGTNEDRAVSATQGGEIAINATDKVTIQSNDADYIDVIDAVSGGKIAIKAKDVEILGGKGKGYGAIFSLGSGSSVDISATNNLTITSEGQFGVHVHNSTETATAPDNRATVNLTADTINITNKTKDGLGLSAFSNGLMNVNGNLTVNADHVIDVRGNSTMNINTDGKHNTVLNGDIVFETPNTPEDAHNSGNIINANVNINLTGENSAWTGKSYQERGEGNISIDLDTGDDIYGDVTGFNLTIADGAAWNATGDSFVNTLNMQNGGLVNNTENHTVNIGEYSAKGDNNTISGGTYNITNTNLQNSALTLNNAIINTDTLKTDTTTINLSKDAAIKTNTLSGNANINLATIAKGDDTFQAGSVTANNAENAKLNVNYTGITADNINNAQKAMQNLSSHIQATDANVTNHVAEGDVAGALTWTSINDAITNVKEQKNSTLSALTNLAANNFLVFRAQTNDLDKRMGDLRTMPNSDGAWARVIAGQSQYKNIHNTYQTLQAGIDHRIGNFIVGGTASYTDGDGTLSHGDSDDKNYTFGLYGSWLNNDGQFIDVIVKRQHLQSDYDLRSDNGLKTKGSYHTEGTSISAEYGWRIGINNTNYYLEPQAEFTYGHLDSVTYKTNRGVKINQDAIKTAVGRVGVAAGWVSPDKTSSAYIKASVLNDWEGDARTKASKDGISRKYHEDMGGTWGEFAIGGTYNLNKNLSFYGEAETTSGNPVRTTYQISAGMRYSF